MKLNKWTVGLAALGLVSLASAAKAEENVVKTAFSSTTLSGYVDTSAQWNFGTGNANNPPYKFGGPSKADGFNLNVVQLRLEKPLDESEWATGYRADLWAGPDANTLGTLSTLGNRNGASDFAIRQAYVSLRMPVGTGLDWKLGVFDSIIGYESVESPNNPNFTRSYGHTIEPQTHTGLLASYRLSDLLSVTAGVANTVNSSINSRAQDGSVGYTARPFMPFAGWYHVVPMGSEPKAESYKAYMGSLALTAPDSMGFLAGSTLYVGAVNGYNNSVFGNGAGNVQSSYYAGATVSPPLPGLRAGAAFDFLRSNFEQGNYFNHKYDYKAYSPALYASYQATEKLSLHARGEYFDENLDFGFAAGSIKVWALTTTAQYDLWQNVLTRLEFRWDHSDDGKLFGGTDPGTFTRENAYMLAGNVVYKF